MKDQKELNRLKYNLLNPYLGRLICNCQTNSATKKLRIKCDKLGYLNSDGTLTQKSHDFLKSFKLN